MARILLAEDHGADLELMGYLLDAFGHTTKRCADGQAALEAIRCALPDLVVCDIQMPRLSGYGLALAVRADAVLRQVPLVAVTALAMHGDRERVLAGGFDGYIEKPLRPDTFVGQVEAFLPPLLRLLRAARPQAAAGGR